MADHRRSSEKDQMESTTAVCQRKVAQSTNAQVCKNFKKFWELWNRRLLLTLRDESEKPAATLEPSWERATVLRLNRKYTH